jgi:two-component system NtrC family response regulator
VSRSILIVDDDRSVTTSLGLLFKQHGYHTQAASRPEEALARLREDRFDVVLQDMNFSRETTGREGLELLREIRRELPELPVVLITAWGSIALAVEGMKAGASDFISKPWDNAHMLQSVETALSLLETRLGRDSDAVPDRTELDGRSDFSRLIGEEPRFLRILELVARVAPTDASVLITGESGTGKELVADAIHRNSRRGAAPFVKVNLGGISSTLFESEMFGHVRGAFTDAHRDRKGRFEVASGGTIFLDEIGELDPNSQVKLLRVLQDRTFEVLGSSESRSVDIRVVSATNRDLQAMVSGQQFREDLLYRLNLISIRLPALRERPADVPLLARHFLTTAGREYGKRSLRLTDQALDWLRVQAWPGNVRQLRQTIERAVLVLDDDRLDARDLTALAELENRDEDATSLPRPGAMTLDEMEKAMIVKCLEHYSGNVTRVAEALGLSRAALYRRFEKYGVHPQP